MLGVATSLDIFTVQLLISLVVTVSIVILTNIVLRKR